MKHCHDRDDPYEYIQYLDSVYDNLERIDPEIRSIVNDTLSKIGKLSAFEIVELSHLKDSPWYTTYHRYGNGHTISDESVRDYFKS